MEVHKLRFVRCPKCYQLLVEYPSIPVYKCGGCSTVLRAKIRAVPPVQARSESAEKNIFPNSLKGSPQDSKSICSDEHEIPSSVDQPCEAAAGGIISSPIKNTNSCEDSVQERAVSVVENITSAQHQKEEKSSLIDENTQNPGITIKEMYEKGTGADLGSSLVGELENLDSSENASKDKVDNVDMSEMRTLHEKTEVVQSDDRLHMDEGMHLESHEALIEELERSLSFSSDDEYHSDEAEASGLSDALRHQMGSHRFVLSGQTNDTSRNDPHGRLIEELEMSFSDAEEPMEQRASGADRIHGISHDRHLQTLDAESANPCEERVPSIDNGHHKLDQTFQHGIKPTDNASNDRNEDIEDGNNPVNDVHGNEDDTHPQILGPNSAHPCEESIASLDNGHHESEKTFLQQDRLIDNGDETKEDTEGDNSIANYAHANEHIVVVNEVSEERFHDKNHDKDLQPANAEIVHPYEMSVSSIDDSDMKFKKTIQTNGLTANHTQENKEGRIDTGNTTNYIHGNGNLVLTDEYIEEKVHGNEDVAFDRSRENEENHMEDGSLATSVHGEENVAVVSEHISEKANKNDHGNDQQSLEAEFSHTRPVKSEVIYLTADISEKKEENCMGDGNMTCHIVVVNQVSEERFHDENHGNDLQPANAEIVHPCERSVSSIDDSDMKFKKTIQPNGLTANDTQENKEGHIDNGNTTNYIHRNENVVLTNEDVMEKIHGNEDVEFDHTRGNEENHMEDGNLATFVHGEENVAVADEHITEKVNKNEHGNDQQSQEAEFSHIRPVKSEVIYQEGCMGDGNMTNSMREDSADAGSFASWSNKRTQCKLLSFNKDKEEAPDKYEASQFRQGLSLDAKDFRLIENFIESQTDGTSSSFSSGSPGQGDLVHRRSNKFDNIVRHERLRKMDELRDQLSRLSSQKCMEAKHQKRDQEFQQQSNSDDVEQHLQSVNSVDSVPNSCTLESYYGSERPLRYQPPNPFCPTHRYPFCDIGHAQAHIPCSNDVWEFNSYYQSSYAESTVLDHDSIMSSYKEQKRVVRKDILRPLSGASPFSICSGCFSLIQMPSDMYISKAKVGKMQCGRCSKVLVLSFPAAHHEAGKISLDILQQSNSPIGSMTAKSKDSSSHFAGCLRGPVSINEEYGASLTRSFSTQAGASLAATQSGKKVSDSALHRLMGYDSASQLLRHSRALDDGYDSFESMVLVSNRVSRRKNM